MRKFGFLATVALLALAGAVTFAAVDTKSVTITATVSNMAKLELDNLSISFPNADPDTSPTLTAPVINVHAKGKTTAAGAVTLSVLAATDLVSGTDHIGIANVSWTAGGTGYVPGALVLNVAQPLGAWTGSGNYIGTQTYVLANSWAYTMGTYTTNIAYTLTFP